MSNPWLEELWRALFIAAISLLVGWPFGAAAWTLLLGLGIYAGWHMRQAYRLERWLRQGKRFHPPEAQWHLGGNFPAHLPVPAAQSQAQAQTRLDAQPFPTSHAALPDATVVLTEGDRIEWWNDAAEDLLGLRHPRDIGQHIGNLIRLPAFIAYLRGGNFDNPIQMPAPGNQQSILSLRLIPFGGDQRLLVARDITRMQQLERMRRDFVANVSHELRTPLTVVVGLSGNLAGRNGRSGGPSLAAYAATMHEQSIRMQGIVEDLLMLSRLETQAEVDQHSPSPCRACWRKCERIRSA